MQMRRILSLDGGGIRGLVSCLWLAGVEQALERAGKPGLPKSFDLLAGSSTGAIVAAGLAIGLAPTAMADLYRDHRHTIFPGIAERLWVRSGALLTAGISAPKYDARGLEEVLQRVFGQATLGDAQVPLLITAYDTISRTPVMFKSYNAKHRALPLWEVCRASSAAPTYFPAHAMKIEGQDCALIDGGVVANNPTACAIAEALRKDAQVDNSRDLVVLSVGTGERTRSIPLAAARGWGALEWAVPIIDVLFDGNTDSVDYIARQLVGDAYFRMQEHLHIGLDDLDDTSSTNLIALEFMAKEYLAKPDTQQMLERLARSL